MNKIFYTTEKEFENKFRNKELRRNSFIVEINGSEIQTWPDFLAKMTEAFNLPYSPNANVYLDWMLGCVIWIILRRKVHALL